MEKIEVGEYLHGKNERLPEGVSVTFDASGLLAIITFAAPTEKEIENIKSGRTRIKFACFNDCIVICLKYGDQSWMDALLNIKSVEANAPAEGEGYALTTLLVDANNSEVKTIRLTATSTEQARMLKSEIERLGLSDAAAIPDLARQMQGKYRTADLVKMAK